MTMAEAASDDSTATIIDFPDHLLLHILSLLPSTLDATQMGLVCRKWQNLWRSLPVLHFSQNRFPFFNTPPETLRCFTDFINRTLILRSNSTPILRFGLQFPFIDQRYASHINSWICHAVNNGVVHLEIDLHKPSDFHNVNDSLVFAIYEFPFPVLRNSCVRVLKICSCEIWFPANSQCVSLRSVTLERVYLTEQMFSDLMLACVNLEDLVIDGLFWDIKHLKICSPKLRKLSFRAFICSEGSLNVVAPNLVTLRLLDSSVEEYDFKEMESLVEVELLMRFNVSWSKLVRLLGNVKHLSVDNFWMRSLEAKDVPFEGFVFNNLNLLEMNTDYSKSYVLGIAAICERSPNLETLILNGFSELDKEEILSQEDLKSISLNVPKLRQVKMTYFRGLNDELLFLTHLAKQGVVLEKIVVVQANRLGASLDGLKGLQLPKDIFLVQKSNWDA